MAGVTTGPYSPATGVTISLNDGNKYGVGSASVQVQNNTGYVLNVYSNGDSYNVQPFTATTIATLPTVGITITPTNTSNVTTGNIYAVWLLAGQQPPMPDGPINVYPTSTTSLTITGSSGGPYTIAGINPSMVNVNIYGNLFLYYSSQAQVIVKGITTNNIYSTTIYTNSNTSGYENISLSITVTGISPADSSLDVYSQLNYGIGETLTITAASGST